MCRFVIVTCRSMLWTLLTITATLAVVAGLITPQWLIGKRRWLGLRSRNQNLTENDERTFEPTVGIFNRCTKLHLFGDFNTDNCATYVTGLNMPADEFPAFWRAALFFFTVAVAMLAFTNITAVLSLCVQSMCRKSIFTISGLIQSVAGLFLIVGLMLYPVGWNSKLVKTLCGNNAGPFDMDKCHLGWAFYCCVGGTILVFICSVLSTQAETSTSSDKVEQEILDGKHLICVA